MSNKLHSNRRNKLKTRYPAIKVTRRSRQLLRFTTSSLQISEGRLDSIRSRYAPDGVKRLRGFVQIKQTIAEMSANHL